MRPRIDAGEARNVTGFDECYNDGGSDGSVGEFPHLKPLGLSSAPAGLITVRLYQSLTGLERCRRDVC
jgi:hypothetical protein